MVKDDLADYLALPQMNYTTEKDATDWWLKHRAKFPVKRTALIWKLIWRASTSVAPRPLPL